MWGQRKLPNRNSSQTRNTPTCVGKTTDIAESAMPSAEHPHVCGENDYAREFAEAVDGTPPRVWGKRDEVGVELLQSRNTPTCVGKTCAHANGIRPDEEHPHVCGENMSLTKTYVASYGTPPRVWGKLAWFDSACARNRNTPTCVGKTLFDAMLAKIVKEHPHVCGENCPRISYSPLRQGTPPRVWGKQENIIRRTR